MLYPELFRQFEAVRWDLASDVPWDAFVGAELSDEQALTVKMNAITEWAALPATEMFLRDNRGDSDFSAFMSIWFYEEQKHALALIEYLRRYRPDLVPTEEELHAVRFEFDPAPALETLMLHFCGEIRLNHWYRRAAEWHTEPVIKRIYELIARDEARHGGAYLRYHEARDRSPGRSRHARVRQDRRAHGQPAPCGQAAAPDQPAREQDALPATTPCRAGCPTRAWLERWLDEQIRFDESGSTAWSADPAQPVRAVRADVRVRAAAQSLPEVAQRRVTRSGRGCRGRRRVPVA